MFNIMFICYGNICRSPMAEMIFKDLIYKNNKRYKFSCFSRATSMEEIGNDIYPPVKDVLLENNVTLERHKAMQVSRNDMENVDIVVVMENRNKRDLLRMFNNEYDSKIILMTEYTDKLDIEDPWYTGNFNKVYKQINDGCIALFNHLLKEEKDEI